MRLSRPANPVDTTPAQPRESTSDTAGAAVAAPRRGMLLKRILLAAAALAVIVGCNTPSVPIPPPALESLAFQNAAGPPGMVVLQGQPNPRHARARFFAINRNNGDGVITTAADDGAFTTTPFAATEGDIMQMFYDTPAGEHSEEVCVQLRIGAPLISTLCQ